jgi:hypothetical protein
VPSAPASSAWVNPGQSYAAAASTVPTDASSALGVYPGLADYMGMELTENVIRENMPEYLPAVRQPVSRRTNDQYNPSSQYIISCDGI